MKAAYILGSLGFLISEIIGYFYLKISFFNILYYVFISNVATFFALWGVLNRDRLPLQYQKKLSGELKAWMLLSTLYFGILLLFCPSLRSHRLFFLIFPLIWSSGFSLIIFGQLRDRALYSNQDTSLSGNVTPQVHEQSAINSSKDFPYLPSDSPML